MRRPISIRPISLFSIPPKLRRVGRAGPQAPSRLHFRIWSGAGRRLGSSRRWSVLQPGPAGGPEEGIVSLLGGHLGRDILEQVVSELVYFRVKVRVGARHLQPPDIGS